MTPQREFLRLLGDFVSAVEAHKDALSHAAERSIEFNDFCLRVLLNRIPFDVASLTHDVADLREMFRKAEKAETELLRASMAMDVFIVALDK